MAVQEQKTYEKFLFESAPDRQVVDFNDGLNYLITFPEQSINLKGPLGDYFTHQDPGMESPLYALASDLKAGQKMVREEQAKRGTEFTAEEQDLISVTHFVTKMIRCIDTAYHNVRALGVRPTISADTVAAYVDHRYAKMSAFFFERKQELSVSLAHEDQTGPDLNKTRERLIGNIKATATKQERLDYEWLAARMIIRALKDNIQDPEEAELDFSSLLPDDTAAA